MGWGEGRGGGAGLNTHLVINKPSYTNRRLGLKQCINSKSRETTIAPQGFLLFFIYLLLFIINIIIIITLFLLLLFIILLLYLLLLLLFYLAAIQAERKEEMR